MINWKITLIFLLGYNVTYYGYKNQLECLRYFDGFSNNGRNSLLPGEISTREECIHLSFICNSPSLPPSQDFSPAITLGFTHSLYSYNYNEIV